MSRNMWEKAESIAATVLAIFAALAIVYSAGAKLSSIETEIIGVKVRLTNIELKVEEILHNGRSGQKTTGRGGGVEGREAVGQSGVVVGLLQSRSRDDPAGAGVLYGNQ